MGEPAMQVKLVQDAHDPNQIQELARFCESTKEPLCVSTKDAADVIMMNRGALEDYLLRCQIDAGLAIAEAQVKAGIPMIPADEVLRKLDERIERAKNKD